MNKSETESLNDRLEAVLTLLERAREDRDKYRNEVIALTNKKVHPAEIRENVLKERVKELMAENDQLKMMVASQQNVLDESTATPNNGWKEKVLENVKILYDIINEEL